MNDGVNQAPREAQEAIAPHTARGGPTTRFDRLLMLGVGLGAWAVVVYGVVTAPLEGLFAGRVHNICGPWGCAARPDALARVHLFWATLLIPMGAMVGQWLAAPKARLAGRFFMAGGAALAVAIAAVGAVQQAQSPIESARQYWPQRAGFDLVTATDIPALQLALAGAACWVSASCCVACCGVKRREEVPSVEAEEAPPA